MKYVSNVIKLEDIEQWNKDDIILIKSPTGSGKSHFVKYILSEYCRINNKTILLLTNRDILKEQNIKELSKQNNTIINIMNYQQIEYALMNGKEIIPYDIIVADETHYFFLDSTFSRKTDISFNWVINHSSLKILLSATCNILEEYLEIENIKPIKYEIKPNYSYINDFYFYYNPTPYIIQDL